ncbi:MAG: hypothetical protein FJ297_06955 [Planctomycetes bacterium]|nr:hypothetical protein [Planctomycetota bacterium]
MGRKTEEVSKTSAIVEYSKANPSHGPKAIVLELKKQGIDVTREYVSSIRSKAGVSKKQKRRRGRKSVGTVGAAKGRRPAKAQSAEKVNVAIANLVEAKKFVKSIGDMAKAKQALEVLASLQ